jgi:hypothetical protein
MCRTAHNAPLSNRPGFLLLENARICYVNHRWNPFYLLEDNMSKEKPTIGIDGLPLPVMPPERDPRVWARMVRVMFYTPGFLALLLIKAGEPASFGITVSLFMLSSATAAVAGLFIGTQSSGKGADHSSKIGVWSGALVLELLSAVPFLCAVPPLFHALAHSALLHGATAGTVPATVGASELLPAVAVLPFMLYQLAGFGTLHYVVTKNVNWILNIGILGLIVSSYIANTLGSFAEERIIVAILVVSMTITVFYGVLKLKQMQATYEANCPPKDPK